MSISSLLFTARDSLNAYQMAIDVTGANIANVDTPGYTQQRAEFQALGSVNVLDKSSQIGVTISRVSRIYDSYVNSQLITQQQNSGYSDAKLQGLQNIETILDDTSGGGLDDQLNNFWAAWENLSQNSSGTVERSALLAASESLVDTISYDKQNLDTVKTDLNSSIADTVSQINDTISEITDLNSRIVSAGNDVGDNNDLLDKRDEALQTLSGMININYFDNDDGSINVCMSNGQPLIQGAIGHKLSVQVTADGQSDIYSTDVSDKTMNSAIDKGKLGAYLELQSQTLPTYINSLNQFATALADGVNQVHSSGYDAYQNVGENFFEITDSNDAAGTIKISDAITNDTNKIAASTSVTGDGTNASNVAAIQSSLLLDNNTSTLNSFLSSIVGQIGHDVSTAQTYDDQQTTISTHLQNQRDSISGVSIDEEMIKLINYQMGYTASAKLCNTVNSLLDELMSIVKS